jgi:hypothetical protein
MKLKSPSPGPQTTMTSRVTCTRRPTASPRRTTSRLTSTAPDEDRCDSQEREAGRLARAGRRVVQSELVLYPGAFSKAHDRSISLSGCNLSGVRGVGC